jgi:XisI protein
MDTINPYRQIIERILLEYTHIPYAYGDLRSEIAFDQAHDRYLLLTIGWDNGSRVHTCLVHIDLIDGKVWIQPDDTEDGNASELVRAGIPKDQIVLGFRPPEVRPYTEYAAA